MNETIKPGMKKKGGKQKQKKGKKEKRQEEIRNVGRRRYHIVYVGAVVIAAWFDP